ncbi:MAG: hypothetical protein E7Z93_07625 [Cyanobacteria bacterium SIG32]|nr:hypothetical protein [Cyanobacteria bacterium SIG32]
MGMAASQARFLGLTARKTNIEYEGQQVNQQRTALANQSANYYNNLLGMSVPVPPSIQDFTKVAYTFEDGSLTNQITSLIANENGKYTISYLSSYSQDFSFVTNPSPRIVTQSGNGDYYIGGDKLRKLGSVYENKEGIGFRWNAETGRYETDVYNWSYYDAERNMNLISPLFFKNQNGKYQIGQDENGNRIYYTYNGTTFNGNPCEKNTFIIPYETHNEVYKGDINFTSQEYTLEYIRERYTPTPEKNYIEKKLVYTLPEDFILDVGSSDEYLASLTEDQMKDLEETERDYVSMLNKKYGEPENGWYVRYIKNTTSGLFEPYFYNADDVIEGIRNENSETLSTIKAYKLGVETKQEEIKGVEAYLEKDSTGRYINITLNPGTSNEVTYALTTNTVTDQAAYDDAMNQYEYDKNKYDQTIQEINVKIEIIQAQDKNLELRLKQLDTEHDAIMNEMDAVQKVIEKNTESTFRTFG